MTAELTRDVTVPPDASYSERRLLRDLGSAGVYVNSVWDLVGFRAPYARARGVLESHLEHGGHPEYVRQGLALALADLQLPRH